MKMTSRKLAINEDFPVDVCELLLPPSSPSGGSGKLIRFPDDSTLPIPDLFAMNSSKVAFIGDTGCRGRSDGDDDQDCDDSAEWPFEKIVDKVVNLPDIDKFPLDIVVHMGDYRYGGTQGYKGGVDSWEKWENEFFSPARPLLTAAPWIFVRGNHEICFSHGGPGWFRFFDYEGPHQTRRCHFPNYQESLTPPYALDIATGLRLIVLDTATAHKTVKPKVEVKAQYETFLNGDLINLAEDKESWVLSHVPFLAVEEDIKSPVGGEYFIPDSTDYLRKFNFDFSRAPTIKAVLAADRHGFQWTHDALSKNKDYPVHLAIGHSGVKLDHYPNAPNPLEVEGLKWDWRNVDKFGFVVATRMKDAQSWNFNVWLASDNDNSDFTPEYDFKLDNEEIKKALPIEEDN